MKNRVKKKIVLCLQKCTRVPLLLMVLVLMKEFGSSFIGIRPSTTNQQTPEEGAGRP